MPLSNLNAADLLRALADAGVSTTSDVEPYALAGMEPAAVAQPTTVDELSVALAAASRAGAAVVPWGGGTRQGLGAPPAKYDLALDMRGLSRVVAHEPADLTVTVEAGCTVGALQARLGGAWQWLPLDPPLAGRATVGGTLAAGIAGPLSGGYGLPREMVIGMRAVLADGTVVKSGGNVVKNVTGFAMDRLHVGGLGTLGVIAEATFKVVPMPVKEATVTAVFDTAEAAADASMGAASIGMPMLSVEVLSDAAWSVAAPSTGSGRTEGGAASVEAGSGWRLLARVGGRAAAVMRSVDAWAAACESHGASVDWLEDAESRALADRVADLGWESGAPELAVRIAVPPSQGAAAMAALGDAQPATALSVTRGVVRAAWGALDVPEDVAAYVLELREQVAALGGAVVVESRAPIDGVDPWGSPGDAFEVMRGLKEQFDPQGILNPGRYLGGL